jgi:UDP-N-acetylglucosamine--N-acetylmuramyl-(pentapeptide) pyrophosphoryl-undecaprenol N-acetylglucosamine transferase
VRGKGFKRLLLGPFALLSAFWQSLGIIRRRAPDVVLGLGGYVSFPGALMAVACNRPLVIHDANAVAGLANRILAYGADRILLGFPGALGNRHARKVEWVGNPLRAEIVAVPPPEQRFAGRHGTMSLLVVGGSLGATALNERGRTWCTRQASATSTRCGVPTKRPASRRSACLSSTTSHASTPTRIW